MTDMAQADRTLRTNNRPTPDEDVFARHKQRMKDLMNKPTLEEWLECEPTSTPVPDNDKQRIRDMDFDYYEYRVSNHFLPALINDDDSGLDPHDFESLEIWLTTVPKDGHWAVIETGGNFTVCEISELFADCATVRRCFRKESNDE